MPLRVQLLLELFLLPGLQPRLLPQRGRLPRLHRPLPRLLQPRPVLELPPGLLPLGQQLPQVRSQLLGLLLLPDELPRLQRGLLPERVRLHFLRERLPRLHQRDRLPRLRRGLFPQLIL